MKLFFNQSAAKSIVFNLVPKIGITAGFIIGFTISMSQASSAAEPSSAIPDKRNFPLSTKIKPCDDFYGYVCSEVNATFKLRDDRSRHTFAFNDSYERILQKNKDFFKNIDKEKKLSRRSQQLPDSYLACMNEEAAKVEEKKYVEKYKNEIEGIKTREELADLSAERNFTAGFSFLGVWNSAHLDNPENWQLSASSSVRYLPERSYYEKADLLKEYEALLVDFFKTVGLDNPEARAKSVVDFEKRFDKQHPLPSEMRQRWAMKRYVSQADLVKKYPNLHLQKVFKKYPAKLQFNELLPEIYAFLNEAFAKEDLSTLKNVMIWRTVGPWMDDQYPELHKKFFNFSFKYLGGPEKRPDREERCTKMVMEAFNKELDAELMPRLFPNFPEKKFISVADKIRASIIKGVESNTWLSPEGKKGALEKIKKARLFLVKPKNEKQWDFNPIQTYSRTEPMTNYFKLEQALVAKELRKVRAPRDSTIWGMGPLTVNAYYSPSDNKFVMPMGILQYPFFDPDGTDIDNLGAVGAVIGHELGHGIDDQGARFDAKGQVRQWMGMNDLAEFKKRGEKMVEQFNKIGHNGNLTLGENIGDLVGLSFGVRAAFPGGDGSIEDLQRFFVGYGRLWCEVMLPARKERQLKTDPHSLGYARVNEQVKHQPLFQKAFSCKDSDSMVLKDSERVKIW